MTISGQLWYTTETFGINGDDVRVNTGQTTVVDNTPANSNLTQHI